MSDASLPSLPDAPARPPSRRFATFRVISALMLREMSSSNGRTAFGYFWTILEPVAGIMVMTAIFSLGFRSPGIGTSFALFFASGILPFGAYNDIQSKTAQAQRFSKALLAYPGVTFMDAILARLILASMTQLLIGFILFTAIIGIYELDVIADIPAMALAYLMCFSLGLGIGTLNSYLLTIYPLWEKAWAIINRPLFIASCVFFMFDTIPLPYRDWLWWNPLVHVIGQMRGGVYATYDASYVSYLYVFTISGVTLTSGLLLLRQYHRDLINT